MNATPPAEAPEPSAMPPDAGVSAVEVVLLTPLIVFMIMLIVSLGMMVNEHSQVNAAARDAARAGSIQTTVADAKQAAGDAGTADLRTKCSNTDLVTSEYVAPKAPTSVGYYRATIRCVMDLTGFGVFNAKQTITATFSAPVDPLQAGSLVP